MEGALGIIEIRGLATAVTVADLMVKTAAVRILDIERAQGGGWMTIKVAGNVAAVNASISAGKQMGEMYSSYISSKVIPRPAADVANLFCKIEGAATNNPAPSVELKEKVVTEEKATPVAESIPQIPEIEETTISRDVEETVAESVTEAACVSEVELKAVAQPLANKVLKNNTVEQKQSNKNQTATAKGKPAAKQNKNSERKSGKTGT